MKKGATRRVPPSDESDTLVAEQHEAKLRVAVS
jgi:hypothetical protein